jgi:hypothetical protein
MGTAAVRIPGNEQSAASAVDKGRRRRGGRQEDQQARYFLAKEGSSPEKPELGAEAANEGEALIKAFQTKSGLLYALVVYKAEAEIQGGSPILVKRSVRK